jgi:hypothetical protein
MSDPIDRLGEALSRIDVEGGRLADRAERPEAAADAPTIRAQLAAAVADAYAVERELFENRKRIESLGPYERAFDWRGALRIGRAVGNFATEAAGSFVSGLAAGAGAKVGDAAAGWANEKLSGILGE